MERYIATSQMDSHKVTQLTYPDTKTPVNTRSSTLQQKELFAAALEYGQANDKILDELTLIKYLRITPSVTTSFEQLIVNKNPLDPTSNISQNLYDKIEKWI